MPSEPFVRWYYDFTELDLAGDPEGNLTKLCGDCLEYIGDHVHNYGKFKNDGMNHLPVAGKPADWEELPCDVCGRNSPEQEWTGEEAFNIIHPD